MDIGQILVSPWFLWGCVFGLVVFSFFLKEMLTRNKEDLSVEKHQRFLEAKKYREERDFYEKSIHRQNKEMKEKYDELTVSDRKILSLQKEITQLRATEAELNEVVETRNKEIDSLGKRIAGDQEIIRTMDEQKSKHIKDEEALKKEILSLKKEMARPKKKTRRRV